MLLHFRKTKLMSVLVSEGHHNKAPLTRGLGNNRSICYPTVLEANAWTPGTGEAMLSPAALGRIPPLLSRLREPQMDAPQFVTA